MILNIYYNRLLIYTRQANAFKFKKVFRTRIDCSKSS